jgi:hypothetical protein
LSLSVASSRFAVRRELEVRLTTDEGGPRVGVLEHLGLELLGGHDGGVVERLRSSQSPLGDLQSGSGHFEVRLRLVEFVAHVSRIDAHQKLPLSGEIAELDRELQDLAGSLRLHVDDSDGLDRTGRHHARHEAAYFGDSGLELRNGLAGGALAAGAGEHHTDGQGKRG